MTWLQKLDGITILEGYIYIYNTICEMVHWHWMKKRLLIFNIVNIKLYFVAIALLMIVPCKIFDNLGEKNWMHCMKRSKLVCSGLLLLFLMMLNAFRISVFLKQKDILFILFNSMFVWKTMNNYWLHCILRNRSQPVCMLDR